MASDTLRADRLQPYLQQRFPDAPDLTVTGVRRLRRGVSRETWVVRLGPSDPRLPAALVVRRDLPGGAICDTSLEFEYDIYRRLMASSVPVARTFWYEHEPQRADSASEFYVREFVEGTSLLPHLDDPDPAYDDLRIETSKEHLRKLALIHTCDWAALGFGEVLDAPPDVEGCAAHTLERLRARLTTLLVDPCPEITEGLLWLRDQAPPHAPRVSLLKGNNGHGEEVWRDGVIVAMSDWELASLGDPTYDFAQLQDLVPVVDGPDGARWDLARALDHYHGVSGIRIEVESLAYYRTMYAVDKASNALSALRMLREGRDRSARLAWVASEVLYRARRELATAAGILPATEPALAGRSV